MRKGPDGLLEYQWPNSSAWALSAFVTPGTYELISALINKLT